MTEVLLYVNEELTCTVIFDDDEDVTVERFRKNIHDEQVDDILSFPYKFTRLVNRKRLVVGAKQEQSLKLARCFYLEADEKAIYLVKEELNVRPEESAASSTITEVPSIEEPALKREKAVMGSASKRFKVSRQPTILDFATGQSPSRKVTSDRYSFARARKVKIFTEREIESSTGLQKIYRRFWNEKAEEICSESNLKSFKPGEVQGAINNAWTLKKTRHIREEIDSLKEEVSHPLSNAILKKVTASNKTTELKVHNKTQEKLMEAQFDLFTTKNSRQRKNAIEKVEALERELEANLTELRKAQDALRKALDVKRELLVDAAQSEKDSNIWSESE